MSMVFYAAKRDNFTDNNIVHSFHYLKIGEQIKQKLSITFLGKEAVFTKSFLDFTLRSKLFLIYDF